MPIAIEPTTVVFEGPDGAGKATQTKKLFHWLAGIGIRVKTLDFPQYKENRFGQLVRECLDGKHGDFLATSPHLAALPYALDRFESKFLLEGWLANGNVVVLDRYVSSNMIHQGAKIGNEKELVQFLELIDALEHQILGLPRPDITFLLDMPLEFRMKLLKTAYEKGEVEDIDSAEINLYHQQKAEERAREICQELSSWHTVECVSDGALRTPEDIHKEVRWYTKECLLRNRSRLFNSSPRL